jgi:hypothetical protein
MTAIGPALLEVYHNLMRDFNEVRVLDTIRISGVGKIAFFARSRVISCAAQ